MRDRFDSARRAASVASEVLVVVAEADEVIPRVRSDALIDAFGTRPRVVVLDGAGHNDIGLDPRYLGEIAAFLVR
jgi:uncharacterized protein